MISTIAPAARGALFLSALLLAQVAPSAASEAAAGFDGERRHLTVTRDTEPPRLRLDSLTGERRGLAEGAGRVRLVHFFATWCEPCRPELASLDALRSDRAAAGLDIIAVSVAEPEARLRRYFAEQPTGLMILLDPDRSASRAWRIEALPSTIVVDRRGRVRLAVRGDLDWGRTDVRAALDAVLAEPGVSPVTTTKNEPEGTKP